MAAEINAGSETNSRRVPKFCSEDNIFNLVLSIHVLVLNKPVQ